MMRYASSRSDEAFAWASFKFKHIGGRTLRPLPVSGRGGEWQGPRGVCPAGSSNMALEIFPDLNGDFNGKITDLYALYGPFSIAMFDYRRVNILFFPKSDELT